MTQKGTSNLMDQKLKGGEQTPNYGHKTLPKETVNVMFDSWKKQGNEFFQKDEFEAAVKCYTTCIELSPRNVVGFTNRALCYLRINEYSKAEEDCNQALSIEDTNVKALFRRAQARKGLKKFNESIRDLEKLLWIDKDNSAARNEFLQVCKLKNCSASKPSKKQSEGNQKCSCETVAAEIRKPGKADNEEDVRKLFRQLANELCGSKMYYYSFLRAMPDIEVRETAFRNKLSSIIQLLKNFEDKQFTSPAIDKQKIKKAHHFKTKIKREYLENRKVRYPVDIPAPEVSVVIDVENDDDILYGDRDWDPHRRIMSLFSPALDLVIGYRLWALHVGKKVLAAKYEGQFLMRINPVLNMMKIFVWPFKPEFSEEAMEKIKSKYFSNEVIKEVVRNGERAENSRQYRIDIALHFISKLYLYAPNGNEKDGMLILDSDIEPSFYKRAVHWNVASQNLWQYIDGINGLPLEMSGAMSEPPFRISLGGAVSELQDIVAMMMESAPHIKDLYHTSMQEPFRPKVGSEATLTRQEAMSHKFQQNCGLNVRARYKNPKPVQVPSLNPALQKRRQEILDVLVKHGLLREKHAVDAQYNLVNCRSGTHVACNNLLGQLQSHPNFSERTSCLFDYVNFRCRNARDLDAILSSSLDAAEMMCEIIDPYGDRDHLDEDEDRDFDELTVAEYIKEPYNGDVYYSLCFKRMVNEDEELHCFSCHKCCNWSYWHCNNCHQCTKGQSAKHCQHCERDVDDYFEAVPNSVHEIHKNTLALSRMEEDDGEEQEELSPRQQNQTNAQMEQKLKNPLYHHYPEPGAFSRIGGSCYEWKDLVNDPNTKSTDDSAMTDCNLEENLHRNGMIGQCGIDVAVYFQKHMDNTERCMLMKTTPAEERAHLQRIYDTVFRGRDISDCCIQ